MKEFIVFIREQGVMGLAIGFILGGAVSTVVASLVNDIINPILGLVLGSVEGLKSAHIPLFGAQILIGNFISVLINFVVIAGVVYFGFKGLGLDKLDKKKGA
jgi:large conductance mechanosensitive channel